MYLGPGSAGDRFFVACESIVCKSHATQSDRLRYPESKQLQRPIDFFWFQIEMRRRPNPPRPRRSDHALLTKRFDHRIGIHPVLLKRNDPGARLRPPITGDLIPLRANARIDAIAQRDDSLSDAPNPDAQHELDRRAQPKAPDRIQ